jgi:hypothetical protein
MGVADMLNGLSDIINGKRTENTPAAAPIPKIPDQLIGVPGKLQVPVLGSEWARQALVQLPQIPETSSSRSGLISMACLTLERSGLLDQRMMCFPVRRQQERSAMKCIRLAGMYLIGYWMSLATRIY